MSKNAIKPLRIGKFNLLKPEPDKVWLVINSGLCAGEGMQVPEAELEKALAEFYEKHF